MTQIEQAQTWLKDADNIIVTAGNGFSIMEGLDMLDDTTFDIEYRDVAEKYKVHTIADALDKKFDSWDEQWQFWSKLIQEYSLDYEPTDAMKKLKALLDGKDYFIATSSYGHFFEKAGFEPRRIFDVFGDWTQMQCSSGLNHGTRSDLEVVTAYSEGHGSVPKCEDCNSPMELHMPLNAHFYPDQDANTRFRWFLTQNQDKKVVVLELGVDPTSPQLLDPMISMTREHPTWRYIAADLAQEDLPDDLQKTSIGLNTSIENVIDELKG
ncbi:Sir2 family NAD-dependent protein deacetylase [uncultured Lactobacillus sp.]|uniref:Sir2 family NAD-dependent protein deacetylase n=1 Tax=uncultured Lactobacillus sp. TaxID=153152 RepID=UPI002619B822|nr:Sir2 family NAD-dependent protein deacetylase [uncultured Lactobacillus sp.]